MDFEKFSKFLEAVQAMNEMKPTRFWGLWLAVIVAAASYAVHGMDIAGVIHACAGR